jgi:cold shock CspA family protein
MAGAHGEALVFDFRVETALGIADDVSAAYGVRFDASGMATGFSFDSVLEGDTVEADSIVIHSKCARATGVRIVRRIAGGGRPGGAGDVSARRRSSLTVFAQREEAIVGGGQGATAPTLPGWVQSNGVNHDGAPLWAGPCSQCGVLCTVPFRPRQPAGHAVSSPPLCRQCRSAQLTVQAQAVATAMGVGGGPMMMPGGMAPRNGTPPPPGGGMPPRHGSYSNMRMLPAPSPPPQAYGSVHPGYGGAMMYQSAMGVMVPSHPHMHGGVTVAPPRRCGIVKFYKAEQGFGFLQPLDSSGLPCPLEPDIFVHVTQVPNACPDAPALVPGQLVEYTEVLSYGRRQAMALVLLGGGGAATSGGGAAAPSGAGNAPSSGGALTPYTPAADIRRYDGAEETPPCLQMGSGGSGGTNSSSVSSGGASGAAHLLPPTLFPDLGGCDDIGMFSASASDVRLPKSTPATYAFTEQARLGGGVFSSRSADAPGPTFLPEEAVSASTRRSTSFDGATRPSATRPPWTGMFGGNMW